MGLSGKCGEKSVRLILPGRSRSMHAHLPGQGQKIADLTDLGVGPMLRRWGGQKPGLRLGLTSSRLNAKIPPFNGCPMEGAVFDVTDWHCRLYGKGTKLVFARILYPALTTTAGANRSPQLAAKQRFNISHMTSPES